MSIWIHQPTGYPAGPPAAPGGPVSGDGPVEPAYKGDVPDEDVEVDPNNAPVSFISLQTCLLFSIYEFNLELVLHCNMP